MPSNSKRISFLIQNEFFFKPVFFSSNHEFVCVFFSYRIISMGTNEKIGVNIHVDQLMDTIASNCSSLERLELR